MKEVNKKVLQEAAHRLLFDMSDSEYQTLLNEFSILTKQMEIIGHITGVDDVQAMTFPFDVRTTYLREDIPAQPLDQASVLQNAKAVKMGQIMLPKVVG